MTCPATDSLPASTCAEPAREGLLAVLDMKMRQARQQARSTGVLLLKLENYRKFEVIYGFAPMLQLSMGVEARIKAELPKKDRIFYLGRGEFGLVLTDFFTPRWQMMRAVDKIGKQFHAGFRIGEHLQRVPARLGGAWATPDEDIDADQLLRRATVALIEAQNKRRPYVLFNNESDTFQRPSLELQVHLEAALLANDLTTVYQPKVDLRTGELAGYEALSRWHSEALGFVRPDVFIEAAERSGLIYTLTHKNLLSVAKHFSTWQGEPKPIAVNLSTTMLTNPDLIALIEASLGSWGMPFEYLTLEVTETALMSSPELSIAMLNALSSRGIRLSIDDFGTGYSSLSYLKMLPVKELKIDKSFVMHMADNDSDSKIVKSVVDLAHNLGLKVVAEGVEDRDSFHRVLDIGCHYAQGYFLSKPLPPAEIQRWQRENAWYRPVRPDSPVETPTA